MPRVPHIAVPHHLPGVVGLFAYRPETAVPLQELAEVLLRGPSSLSRGERELIAAYVSRRNECEYCCSSHSAFAGAQLDGGRAQVEGVLAAAQDPWAAPVTPKLRALLAIAGLVQGSGLEVSDAAVASARVEGATDLEVHDTVLIAAAFCMFNRYVDGLRTSLPADDAEYQAMARRVVCEGYTAARPDLAQRASLAGLR
jgi:uncharacterized peroxidase-related enzyme